MLIQHMSELRPGGLADVGEEDISDLLVLYKCVASHFQLDIHPLPWEVKSYALTDGRQTGKA